jgi:prolyl-tRNA synthetase
MMGDGKALQMGTSHELGQGFAEAFGIQYSDTEGVSRYVWQTSWGVSTRLIGGIVMVHGDDFGLRLPPALAPVEVVVLVVRDEEDTRRAAEGLVAELEAAGRRARLDTRTAMGFGRRSVEWELKGVPTRVEIGPRELAAGEVTLVTRHRRAKETVPLRAAVAATVGVLDRVGPELYEEAAASLAARVVDATTIESAIEGAGTGFVRIPWSRVGEEGEERLAAQSVSVRCLQTSDDGMPGDDETGLVAVVGRAY